MVQGQPAAVDRESFDQLRREHRRLREDFDRLLQCLGGEKKTPAGAVAKFFKGKFEAVRRRRPLGAPRARLPNSLQRGPLSLVQRFCGGREELLRLREVSGGSRACTDAIFTGYELYILGGRDLNNLGSNLTRRLERLTVSNGTWEVIGPLSMDRCYWGGTSMDGYFYFYGALDHWGAAVLRYGLATKQWEDIAFLNKRRSGPGAAVVGGRLYVCGGEDMPQRECHSSVEWLDLSVPPDKAGLQGAWRLLPITMSAMRRHCVAAAIPGQDGKEELFICGSNGGDHPWGTILATVDCYDPMLRVWSCCAPMPQPRLCSMAVVLAGCLYILGGKSPSGDPKSVSDAICYPCSVYCFDPATGEWEAAPWELVRGREWFGTAVLWSGVVRTGDLAA